MCVVFVTNMKPAHGDSLVDVLPVDVVHHEASGAVLVQLDGVEVHAGGDVGPEVVVAGVDGAVAEAPVDGGSRRLEKSVVRVENGGEADEGVDVLVGDVEEILKTTAMILRIGEMAPILQIRDQLDVLHRLVEGNGIGDLELVLQQIPAPVLLGVVGTRDFVETVRQIVLVQVDGVQEGVIVEEEVARIGVWIRMAEHGVPNGESVVAVGSTLFEGVVHNAQILPERGGKVHDVEALVEQLVEPREVLRPEEGQTTVKLPVMVHDDEVYWSGSILVVMVDTAGTRISLAALLFVEILLAFHAAPRFRTETLLLFPSYRHGRRGSDCGAFHTRFLHKTALSMCESAQLSRYWTYAIEYFAEVLVLRCCRNRSEKKKAMSDRSINRMVKTGMKQTRVTSWRAFPHRRRA